MVMAMVIMVSSIIMLFHLGYSELQFINMKSLKTPLRYPGGKSRALTKIFSHVPDLSGYDEFREPFVGGGSVAIHVTKEYPDLKVWVNDLYEPLYNFWVVLKNNGDELYKELKSQKCTYPDPVLPYGPQQKEFSKKYSGMEFSARELFLKSKEIVNNHESDLLRAAAFYVVNKCSFSGLTEVSSFSKQASVSNFSMRGIDRIPSFSKIIRNWTITNTTYQNVLDEQSEREAFIYLDPPYDIKDNLYGKKGDMHKGFDHDDFAKNCDECGFDLIVSYNSDQLIKDRFKNKKWIDEEFDHTYTLRSVGQYMREQKDRKELLLFNYGTERLAQLN